MKSKGFLLATAATGAALAPNAMAADLKAPAPVVVPPATNWTGWYVGLHAGAAWHQAHTASVYTGTPLDAATGTGTGFIGGGQIGYNWQRGNFVVGVEADGSWLSAKARATNDNGQFGTYGLEGKIRWLSTVRGRFGLAVGDTMAYATAGVAFGGVRNGLLFGICGQPECLAQSQSKTRIGWTVGGGVEHMWNRNWSIALEGLFVDLGRSKVSLPVGPNPAFTKTTTFSNQAVVGRLKLNYKW